MVLSAPRFVGQFTGEIQGLAIEFIEDAHTLAEAMVTSVPWTAEAAKPIFKDQFETAARWAGRFHAVNGHAAVFIKRYDLDYYRQWPERTAAFGSDWHDRLPWLEGVCRRSIKLMRSLAERSTTIIHGEFTPLNVLIKTGIAYPIDWETAALGLGEIDLAALIDKWDPEVAHACEVAYQAARWPDGSPKDFSYRLDLARLYWDFRWLSGLSEWMQNDIRGFRFEHLRQVAERLELL